MTDYSKGKIYKIEPICEHEEGEIYIGSTTKNLLSQRMTTHRGDYNKWKNGKSRRVRSYDLFDKYGLENCKILLIESFPCQSRDELRAREGHFIKTLKCVNKAIAGGQDQKEYIKKYQQENKESIKENKKIYYKENKESIQEYKKLHYEKNKESILEYQKINYEKNKETILAKKLQKKTCICGCEYVHCSFQRHCRSKKHKDFILNNPQP